MRDPSPHLGTPFNSKVVRGHVGGFILHLGKFYVITSLCHCQGMKVKYSLRRNDKYQNLIIDAEHGSYIIKLCIFHLVTLIKLQIKFKDSIWGWTLLIETWKENMGKLGIKAWVYPGWNINFCQLLLILSLAYPNNFSLLIIFEGRL